MIERIESKSLMESSIIGVSHRGKGGTFVRIAVLMPITVLNLGRRETFPFLVVLILLQKSVLALKFGLVFILSIWRSDVENLSFVVDQKLDILQRLIVLGIKHVFGQVQSFQSIIKLESGHFFNQVLLFRRILFLLLVLFLRIETA